MSFLYVWFFYLNFKSLKERNISSAYFFNFLSGLNGNWEKKKAMFKRLFGDFYIQLQHVNSLEVTTSVFERENKSWGKCKSVTFLETIRLRRLQTDRWIQRCSRDLLTWNRRCWHHKLVRTSKWWFLQTFGSWMWLSIRVRNSLKRATFLGGSQNSWALPPRNLPGSHGKSQKDPLVSYFPPNKT